MYENKVKEANAKENFDGTYNLDLKVFAKKVYSDSLGIQSNGVLKDWLEIGVFGKSDDSEDSLIYLKKVFITDSISRFDLKLDSKKLYKTKNISSISVEDVLAAAKQNLNF